MDQDLPPLEDLMERLDKADGHLNAAEKRLSEDRERGLWSARQAAARVGEAWFSLGGAILPPMERYLPRDVLQQKLGEFEHAAAGTPLAGRFREITQTEAKLLAAPELTPPYNDRSALLATLDCQSRYLDAVRALKQEVENAVADLYLFLRPGDWARLPNGHVGRMIARPGLVGEFFIPAIAVSDPARAFKGWVLSHPAVSSFLMPIAPPTDAPIETPAYYWLLEAHRHWREAHRLAATDWATIWELRAVFNTLLDAASKAWLCTQAGRTNRPHWSHVDGRFHVRLLSGTAPTELAGPLVEAERCIGTLSDHALGNFSRLPPGWRREVVEALHLARQAMTTIGQAVQHEVRLAAGQWVRIAPYGCGRIACRDSTRLVVDFSPNGVKVLDLFEALIEITPPPDAPPLATP